MGSLGVDPLRPPAGVPEPITDGGDAVADLGRDLDGGKKPPDILHGGIPNTRG